MITVKRKLQLSREAHGRRRIATKPSDASPVAPVRIPRISRLVAVAINGDVIPKDQYAAATVRAGDALEVVRMVGGGAR